MIRLPPISTLFPYTTLFPISGKSDLVQALNEIACEYQFPVYPTASPYIISVGGTEWKEQDSSKPIAWSRTGGGFSWQFEMPVHQAKAVGEYLKSAQGLPPASSFNTNGRAYPDISAVAVEGTSQSAPLVAGNSCRRACGFAKMCTSCTSLRDRD